MAAITDVTILTTATSILLGTETGSRPLYLLNPRSNGEDITLDFAGSADDYVLAPGKFIMVLPGMVVTGTSVSGTAELQVLRGVVPDDDETSPAYDANSGGLLSWRLNPERAYTLPQQEVDSGVGDGTVEWFVAFEGYTDLSIQIQDTPGATGLNTYKVYASAEAGNIDDDSATYIDIGSAIFGAASWITDAYLINSIPFRAKYVKIERVRTLDAAATDGGSTLDIQGG